MFKFTCQSLSWAWNVRNGWKHMCKITTDNCKRNRKRKHKRKHKRKLKRKRERKRKHQRICCLFLQVNQALTDAWLTLRNVVFRQFQVLQRSLAGQHLDS